MPHAEPRPAMGLPPLEHEPERVRDALRDILERLGLDEAATGVSAFARLVNGAASWLWDQLAYWLGGGWLGPAGEPGGVWVWVAAAALLAGLALVVFLVARTVRRSTARRTGAEEPGPRRRSAPDWRAQAARLEGAGDWLGGLRCRYRALVAALADGGNVIEVPGTTTGEYLAQIRTAVPGAATAAAAATGLFERAWYGNEQTGAQEAARFGQLADEVLDEAGRTRAEPASDGAAA